MHRTYQERPFGRGPAPLQRLRKRGWLPLLAGGVLVGLLLLGNVAAFVAGEALAREDAAYRQPPQWHWLEHLLYRPHVHVEPYTGPSGAVEDLLGYLERDDTPTGRSDRSVTFTSRPVYAATANRPYRYATRVTPADVHVRYEVDGPRGVTISDAGVITWTPQPIQVGRRSIQVRAVGPGGLGSRQSFTVVVSERFHPLGTDERGRDLAAALVLGTRWAVLPGLVAAGLSVLLGTLFGGLAGYYGGRLDAALGILSRMTEAFPALILLFLAAVIFRFALLPIMAVLGIILLPGTARAVRARVQHLKAQQFVEAARELGLPDARILWHDVVWHNARDIVIQRTFYALALAVVVEVTLSYLRIGIQPPTVSWGTLIYSGRALLYNSGYWLIAAPALATALAVAGYSLLGRGLARTLSAATPA